jgi:Ni/Co efflux regulator RcnB
MPSVVVWNAPAAAEFAEHQYAHTQTLARAEDEPAAQVWCRQRFGRPGAIRRPVIRKHGHVASQYSRYTVRSDKNWCHVGRRFFFQDEMHAFEFKMRWA